MINLGRIYYCRNGVTKDLDKSKYLYQRAADYGSDYAQEVLETGFRCNEIYMHLV